MARGPEKVDSASLPTSCVGVLTAWGPKARKSVFRGVPATLESTPILGQTFQVSHAPAIGELNLATISRVRSLKTTYSPGEPACSSWILASAVCRSRTGIGCQFGVFLYEISPSAHSPLYCANCWLGARRLQHPSSKHVPSALISRRCPVTFNAGKRVNSIRETTKLSSP
jgi:hypothetical protein